MWPLEANVVETPRQVEHYVLDVLLADEMPIEFSGFGEQLGLPGFDE